MTLWRYLRERNRPLDVRVFERGDARLGRQQVHDPRARLYDARTAVRWSPLPTQHVRHQRYAPVWDQQDLGMCHDDQTQVLTESGWRFFAALSGEERLATVDPVTSELSYERPTRIVSEPYRGDMYYVAGRTKDFAVTPNHSMVVRPWNERTRRLENAPAFVAMKDVGWYAGLIATVEHRGYYDASYTLPGVQHRTRPDQRCDREVPMTAWLRFLGIYLAEGTVLGERYKVQLAAFKEREKAFIRSVLAELGLHALELPSRFVFNNKQVWSELTRLGLGRVLAPNKFVPPFVRELAPELIEQVLLGHWMGDGCEQGEVISHYTSSERLADDLHELVLLAGKWGTLTSRAPRIGRIAATGQLVRGTRREYRVSCTPKTALSLVRKKEVRVEHYDGTVYCAEVPTHHTLVTRRNGRVLVSGNCTAMAALGMLSSGPFWHEQHAADPRRVAADRVRTDGLPPLTGVLGAKPFTEADGMQLYREETRLDDRVFPGHWEPDDTGSSGDWSMAALRDRGLLTGWTHAFRWQDVVRLLARQPISVGVPWYEAMFEPDPRGYVTIAGQVQGGHQFVVDELIPVPDASGRGQVADYTLGATNSWGLGFGASGRFYMTGPIWRRLLAEGGDVVSGKL